MFTKTGMRNSQGFTLVEMAVVMVIVGILAAMLVPNMTDMLRRNRLATATNEFLSNMAATRSEAARIGLPVVMTATGGSFNNGWCIHTGNSCTAATALRQKEALTGIKISGQVTAITFGNLGQVSIAGGGGGGVAGSQAGIIIQEDKCVANANWARMVSIFAAGRAQVDPATCQ